MSDSNATPSEPEASNIHKTLDERLKLSADNTQTNGSSTTPAKFNWADEVETPIEQKKEAEKGSSLEDAQKDGATTWLKGSQLDEPEYDVQVQLADLQEDPNHPLYSAKSFDDLNLRKELLEGLAQMNFTRPSKIQERALPLLLKNPPQNLIGQSQSGTGKTAAFTLNILSRIDLSTQQPQAIVLAPTRELARQISGVVQIMGTFLIGLGLKVTEAIPNPAMRGQKYTGQVLVGTAGTVSDGFKRRYIDASGVKILTLDEADNMLDLDGMGNECLRIKRFVPNAQVVLFSATFAPAVLEFADRFAPNANKLTLEVEKLTVKGIKQMYLDCNNDEEKYNALVKFYGLMTIASSIIFVRKKDTAAEIEKRMVAEGHSVAQLTSNLVGVERDDVFNKFRSGAAKVLITTNVLSRGIDVQTVTMVINYDIPTDKNNNPDYETYLHRIGRTGRFGRTGAALSFVHDRKSWQNLMDICKYFSVEPTKLDTSDWDEVEKTVKSVMRNTRNVIPGS